jgi:hypothetical protein
VVPLGEFIPFGEAWARVGKMLCPDEKITQCTARDDWLINRYSDPSKSIVFPGDDDGPSPAPAQLVSEVDRAYFRRSLEEFIVAWFQAAGFIKPPFPRKEFEQRLAVYRRKPKPAETKFDGSKMGRFVSDYLKNEGNSTLRGVREKWRDAGYGAHGRDQLDIEYRNQAAKLEKPVKRGRRPKRATK